MEEYIFKHFKYNKDGTITRDDRKNSLGSYDKDGYLILKIKGKQFKAHRIAWLLNYGEFPKGEIDHINRCRTDNRIENLIPLREIIEIINNGKLTFWDKRVEQDDFLTVRIGTGNEKMQVKINYPEDGFTIDDDKLKLLEYIDKNI